MSTKAFKKLKTKLAELFQLDQADLDFGIYRIMNARRDEINQFLESDLLPQVREAFGEYKSSDKAEIQKQLDKLEATKLENKEVVLEPQKETIEFDDFTKLDIRIGTILEAEKIVKTKGYLSAGNKKS